VEWARLGLDRSLNGDKTEAEASLKERMIGISRRNTCLDDERSIENRTASTVRNPHFRLSIFGGRRGLWVHNHVHVCVLLELYLVAVAKRS
jgi:hypothetical protein